MSNMVHYFKKFSLFMQRVTTFIFLHLAYVFGIGITSGIGKLRHVLFLPMRADRSTWVKHKTDGSIRTMY